MDVTFVYFSYCVPTGFLFNSQQLLPTNSSVDAVSVVPRWEGGCVLLLFHSSSLKLLLLFFSFFFVKKKSRTGSQHCYWFDCDTMSDRSIYLFFSLLLIMIISFASDWMRSWDVWVFSPFFPFYLTFLFIVSCHGWMIYQFAWKLNSRAAFINVKTQ